jgi:aarF domain-containing kinase
MICAFDTSVHQSLWVRCYRSVQKFWRVTSLCCRFVPLLLAWPFVYYVAPFMRKYWYQWLRNSLESGACLIKLGQWAATRPDIFPWELCDELGKLHQSAPEHRWGDTEAVLVDAFGGDELWRSRFSEFDPVPLASGAIAQVYRARLAESGDEVAVKVRHPDVAHEIARDLSILRSLASLLADTDAFRYVGLESAAAEFSRNMFAQIDLRVEAQNLNRFRRNFDDYKGLYEFPRPIEPFNEAVLVESFESGLSIAEFMRPVEPLGSGAFRSQLAYIGLAGFLKMLIRDNFVHADLHVGNVLVSSRPRPKRAHQLVIDMVKRKLVTLRDATGNDQVDGDDQVDNDFDDDDDDDDEALRFDGVTHLPRMIVLDVGLVTELTQRDRESFLSLFACVVRGDGKAGARLMIERSPAKHPPPQHMIDSFTEKLDALFVEATSVPLHRIPIGATLRSMIDLAREHQVLLESNFITLVAGIIVVEGVGRQLKADFNLLEEAAPLLAQSEDVMHTFFNNRKEQLSSRFEPTIGDN